MPIMLTCNFITAIHNFDIIYLWKTYLDFSTPSDDNNLEISGYTLVLSDHQSNNKTGGVCIYCKSVLPLRILNICKKAFVLNLKLVTKRITFYLSTDRQAKVKMKTLN